jgi:phosphopantetheinyl transferase
MTAIEIYLTSVEPLAQDFSAAYALLPPSRRQKIDRYRQEGDRRRSLAAGLLLHWLLGVEKDEDLAYGPFGQPRLARGGPFFSLSHSGEEVGLAFGPFRLGLDLEKDRPDLNWERLAPRILTPEELALRDKWPDPSQFTLAAWALKESLAKAVGAGLSFELLAHGILAETKPKTYQGESWLFGLFRIGGCVNRKNWNGHLERGKVREEIDARWNM